MIKARSLTLLSSLGFLALAFLAGHAQARNMMSAQEDQESAVAPSPPYLNSEDSEIERIESSSIRRPTTGRVTVIDRHQAAASEPSGVPVYVSPFVRAERSRNGPLNFDHQESSHAPPNYAPRPMELATSAASGAAAAPSSADLKTSASYGHHYGGHHGYGHGGWLDMGAWTGGKGSFGWYADYPVGKHGYGKRR